MAVNTTLTPTSHLTPSKITSLLTCRNPSFYYVAAKTRVSLRCRLVGTTSVNALERNANLNCIMAERLNNVASPWLMLPPEIVESTGEKIDRFYSVAHGQTLGLSRTRALKVPDTTKCIASTMGWLGFVDTEDGSVYLSNPYLNDVVQLPSLEKLPHVLGVHRDPKTGAILKFKVRLSHDEHVFCEHNPDPYTMVKPKYMAWGLSNLALSEPDPRAGDCVVMGLRGDPQRRLVYCHIGTKFDERSEYDLLLDYSDCWFGLQEEEYRPDANSNQIVYSLHTGRFYTLFEYKSGIVAYDVQSDRGQRSKKVSQLPMDELERALKRKFDEEEGRSEELKAMRSCKRKYYLVTLENGDLLLIVRHYLLGELPNPPHKTLHFDVFRVVYDLERVKSLDNRAIFVGWNQSFCLKVCDSPGVRPNCIYFGDDLGGGNHNNVHVLEQWSHDNGIFCVKDGSISPCYPYRDAGEEKKVNMSEPIFWVAPLPETKWYMAKRCGLDFFDVDMCTYG